MTIVLSNIRKLKLMLNELNTIFYKECGKTFIIKDKSNKNKVDLIIIPTTKGYSVSSTDRKYIAGIKDVDILKKQIKKIFPK